MKTRQGFVSNSSSSSFVISRDKISADQLEKIQNHWDYALSQWPEDEAFFYIGCYSDLASNKDYDQWEVFVEDENVTVRTDMDNFDMRSFLTRIGVPDDAITWENW